MPRNGSGVYSKPANTAGVAGQTIESAKYNQTIDDLVQDANLARPVTAGGTGQTSIAAMLAAFGIEPGTDVQEQNAFLQTLSDQGDVRTADIQDANVTTAKLADGAVTTAKVDDGAITQAKLAASVYVPRFLAEIDLAGLTSFALTAAMVDPAYIEYIVKVRAARVTDASGGLLIAETSDDDGATFAGAGNYITVRETFGTTINNPPVYLDTNPANNSTSVVMSGSSGQPKDVEFLVRGLTDATRQTHISGEARNFPIWERHIGATTLLRAENHVRWSTSSPSTPFLAGSTVQIFGVPA